MALGYFVATLPIMIALFIELRFGPFAVAWLVWVIIGLQVVYQWLYKNNKNTGGQQLN